MLSENDSEGSNVESLQSTPYSSPVQQVPSTSGKSLKYLDDISLHGNGKKPYLRIVIQPAELFRFRYEKEKGTHGCIQGRVSNPVTGAKTYPSVELKNHFGRAVIKCQLYQIDKQDRHPHRIYEDNDDVALKEVYDDCIVSFRGLGVMHTPRKKVPGVIYTRIENSMSPAQLRKINKEQLVRDLEKAAKHMDLNKVRLRFSAHDIKSDNEICEPVFSEPIYNSKSNKTNELKIALMSRKYGPADGTATVMMFCEKIDKGSVNINIFEKDAYGNRVDLATVNLTDEHIWRLYGIAFTMPKYKDGLTSRDAPVYIELHRSTDGRRSEPVSFTYTPTMRPRVRAAVAAAAHKHKHPKRIKYNPSVSLPDAVASPATSIPSISDASPSSVNTLQIPIEHEKFGPISVGYEIPLEMCEMGQVQSALGQAAGQAPTDVWSQAVQIPMFDPAEAKPFGNIEITNYDVIPTTCTEIWQTVNPAPESYLNYMSSAANPMLSQASVNAPNFVYNAPVQVNQVSTNEEIPAADFLHFQSSMGSTIKDYENLFLEIHSDSGRPLRTKSKKNKNTKQIKSDKVYFTEQDGLEVKKLIKEIYDSKLCSENWINEVKPKLQRLFEIRQTNGDTFVHMTLTSHLPSCKFLASVASEAGMSYLLDAVNDLHLTVLHLAVLHDIPKAVTFLVEKGCDPLCTDLKGNTVFHHAVLSQTSMAALLEAIDKKGDKYDLDKLNKDVQTPLHLAVSHGSEATVRLLLKCGASKHLPQDYHGRTALHLAVELDNSSVLRTLLEFVAPETFDTCNWKKMTALQIACAGEVRENTLEIIKLLLEKGANPSLHDKNNKPAWRSARRRPDMWDILKHHLPEHTDRSPDHTDDDQTTSEDDEDDTDDDDFLSADEFEGTSEEPDATELDITAKLQSVRLNEGAIVM